jgi:hypothetical protein
MGEDVNMNIARELIAAAKDVMAARKLKYRGYTIEESGFNYYITDPSGHRAFGEVPASVETAKKWIDMDIREKGRTGKEVVAWERMNLPRSFYIPKNALGLKQLDEGKDIGLEFWSYEDGRGGVYGLAFGGKANKPLWHYRFRNQEKFEEQVRLTISDRKSHAERIEKQKQERTQYRHTLKEGDILYSSWGYDQTNIDFYQVVGVAEKSVKIREIEKKVVGSGDITSDHVIAAPNHFAGPPMTKVVRPGDVVSIASYANAYKWDGKPKYQTALGFGH